MGIYRTALEDVPFLPVRLAVPSDEAQALVFLGRDVPSPIVVRMVIDTGSRRTSITPRVVQQLKRSARGTGQAQTALAQAGVNYFAVRLELLSGSLAALPTWYVSGLPMPPKLRDFDGLIGRDILKQWELLYSGIRERLSIRDYASVWGWLAS